MTIDEMVAISYQMAVDKGWNEKEISFGDQCTLLHSEISEAFESYRNHEPLSWTDNEGKPQGIASEFADIFIRLGHYIRLNNIDITAEIKRKWAYNATRPHRHGGKRA